MVYKGTLVTGGSGVALYSWDCWQWNKCCQCCIDCQY